MAKKSKHRRLAPDVRKQQIIDEGLKLAHTHGYLKVSAAAIAEAIEISDASVFHHFPTMDKLRRALIRTAITRQDLVVIGQGIDAGDRYAMNAPAWLRESAEEALNDSQPWRD